MHGRDVDVLLVEDDEAIRDTLCEVLEEEGYIVATAGHGAQALALLQAGMWPQLILLDLMMPVMDGWQLLRHLHASSDLKQIPVIVVSAARDTLPKGATRYLHKPIDLETLLAAVENQCPLLGAALGQPTGAGQTASQKQADQAPGALGR